MEPHAKESLSGLGGSSQWGVREKCPEVRCNDALLSFFPLPFQSQDEVLRLAASLGDLGLEPGPALWMGDDSDQGWPRLLHQVGRAGDVAVRPLAFWMCLLDPTEEK